MILGIFKEVTVISAGREMKSANGSKESLTGWKTCEAPQSLEEISNAESKVKIKS